MTTIAERFRSHPENAAAIVNACLVALIPATILGIAVLLPDVRDTGVTVRPPGVYRNLLGWLAGFAFMVSAALPFAVAAGWRTLVHARHAIDTGVARWSAVGEGALLGFAGAVLVLLPGILTRPLDAPPYILAYGGLCALVGAAVAFALRISALLVLGLLKERSA